MNLQEVKAEREHVISTYNEARYNPKKGNWRRTSKGRSHVEDMKHLDRNERKNYLIRMAQRAADGDHKAMQDLRETACDIMSDDRAIDKAEEREMLGIENFEKRKTEVNRQRAAIRNTRYNTKHKEFKVKFVSRMFNQNIKRFMARPQSNSGRAWRWARDIYSRIVDGRADAEHYNLLAGWVEHGNQCTLVFTIAPSVNAPSKFNNVDCAQIKKLTTLEYEVSLIKGDTQNSVSQIYNRMKNKYRSGRITLEQWVDYQESLKESEWDAILDADQPEENWGEEQVEALREDCRGNTPIYDDNYEKDEHNHFLKYVETNICEDTGRITREVKFVEKDDTASLEEYMNYVDAEGDEDLLTF